MTTAGLQGDGEILDGKVWFARKGKFVLLGITNSCLDEVGEVEGVDFPEEGDVFENGDVVVTVSGTQSSFEIVAPVAGTVVEVNEAVKTEPGIVGEDPLEEGWLLRLDIAAEADTEENEDEEEEENTEDNEEESKD